MHLSTSRLRIGATSPRAGLRRAGDPQPAAALQPAPPTTSGSGAAAGPQHQPLSERTIPRPPRIPARRRTPRRRPLAPHTPGGHASTQDQAATRAAQAAAISAVARQGSARRAPAEPHDVARATRMRAVHAPASSHHMCGLCLSAWPCPPRSWAEDVLRGAHLDAAG
ncbi:MAG: hypothetical protein QOI35_481 [Cryptosporangiaceae bacterium]|jgi:hypothetical protein|nr:hypothetical protein [Cryptosporangiaceae bacterium]MDQ1656963.1 hypothetical protein [Cryptosporangiaceae bacterium]